MTNHVLLNNKTLAHLKVITKSGVKFGDNISNTLTFPTEFTQIQKEYPILFSKNPETGEFQSVVLFGLKKDENLYLKRGKWQASYIPAVITKGPFIIGHEDKEVNGKVISNAIIYVNMDHPRISETDGEPVFLENGENSPYLNKITQSLATIDEGANISKAMFAAFNEYNLIEPIALDIEFNNGEQISLTGNYTIHREKLAQLDGDALAKLNRAGFLQMAFSVVSSLENVQKLVDLKNATL